VKQLTQISRCIDCGKTIYGNKSGFPNKDKRCSKCHDEVKSLHDGYIYLALYALCIGILLFIIMAWKNGWSMW
jgi:hypothetical protein